MGLQILLCVLAAGGLVLLCWSVAGWILGGSQLPLNVHCVVSGDAPELEQLTHRMHWLQSSGILTLELVILDDGLTQDGRRRAEMLCRRYAWVVLTPRTQCPET